MKKLSAILLVIVMLLTLVACGKDEPNPAIVAYMNKNGDAMISSMEQGFSQSSGMTCKANYEVIGNGIVINLNINELDNVDSETKAQMQTMCDALGGSLKLLLPSMQAEIPELEYFTMNICEVDGEVVASITVE